MATLLLGLGSAFAHDKFRIIGTIVRYEKSTLAVRNREGKTLSVRVDKQTAINRDNKKVDATELKAGQSVVVDAYGDTEDDSLAIEIRLVPPIAAR
ncbi:MAG: hypothetical protein HY824_17005 [Acidobacteria bacterium]|nr:hypothetical protein [Acidobacteriota bacterium]